MIKYVKHNMADDYEDSILVFDSDDESNIKSKKSKASDFIPKPRILIAPVSKIASIAHSQRSSLDDPSKHAKEEANLDIAEHSAHSSHRLSTEKLDAPTVRGASPRKDSPLSSKNSSLQRVHVEISDNGVTTPPASVASVEQSTVHLVVHPVTPPPDVKTEEGTYKRLISHSPSIEDQTDNYDAEMAKNQSSCLCRVIKHPTIRRNWKVYLGSIILTILGLGLIILGVIVGYHNENMFKLDLKYVIYVVGGILLLMPGSYHFVFMSLAACDVPGFKFSKLPTLR